MAEDKAKTEAAEAATATAEKEAPKAKKTTRKRTTKKKAETMQFQAETRQLLNLMIHSLYTHKDVFLRELISNASDALDKVRFRSLTDSSLLSDDESLEVWISINKDAKTISISDNGIGMSREDVINNIGTIARSGSKQFIQALKDKQEKGEGQDLDLIGQFGVGFYSSFMVADRVEVVTRGIDSDAGVRWESAGEGEFTLEEAKVPSRGTTITLHLREDVLDPSDPAEDYLNQYTVQNLVKKYSDFITYPVKMNFEKEVYPEKKEGEEEQEDQKPTIEIQEKTLNSQKPLWARPKEEITDEEYGQFFKHHFHDWNEPQEILHVKGEGTVEYTALLYIPSQAPFNLYAADYKKGIQLYAKHVFVMDRCESLLPDHLRFVKGLIDSPDFSLNVSREILQHDRQLKIIGKSLEKKVMDALKKMLKNKREDYEKWWEEFGKAIKGGIYMEYQNKEKLQDLLVFPSSHKKEGMTTLKEYVERMPEDQTEIYYEVGKSREAIERLPQMEAIREKGLEVLYFTDKVDEFLTQNLFDYDDKKLKSVSRGDLDLDGKKDEDKEDKKDEEKKEEESKHKELLDKIKDHLGEKVKEVRISKRLKSSACCLVSGDQGMSFNMEMLMKEANQPMGKAQRILELNEDHETFKIMVGAFEKDKENTTIKNFAEIFYNQALLIEGLELDDPVAFAKAVNELMVQANK